MAKIIADQDKMNLINDRIASLAALGDKDFVNIILMGTAEVMLDDMKGKAPVRYGRLKNNIRLAKGDYSVILESTARDPKTRVNYAPFMEYGTKYINKRPYFFDSARKRFGKLYRDFVDRIRAIKTGKALPISHLKK